MSSIGITSNSSFVDIASAENRSKYAALAKEKTNVSPSQGQALFLEANKTAKALLASNAAYTSTSYSIELPDDTPELLPPKSDGKKLTSQAKLQLLLGQLVALFGDMSIEQLESRLEMFKAFREMKKEEAGKLGDKFDTSVDEADRANKDASAKLAEVAKAKERIAKFEQAMQLAKQELATLSKDDPTYGECQSAYQEAKAGLNMARNHLATVTLASEQALAKAVNASKASEAIIKEIQGLPLTLQPLDMHKQSERQLSSIAAVGLLIGQMMQLIGENEENSLKNDMEMFKTMKLAHQQAMEKKSAEFEEQIRKQEEMQKTMGCVGKILGALITVLSIAGAAFTGGASLALAAVGVALMAGDAVSEALGGPSLTGTIMNAVMDNVISPFLKEIGKLVQFWMDHDPIIKSILSGILKETGVDISEWFKTAVAVVVAAIIIIGVAMLAKSAAKSLIDKFGKVLLEKIGKAVVQKVATDVAKKGFTQQAANRVGQAAMTGTVINGAVQGGMTIEVGRAESKAKDALAEFTLAQSAIDRISGWIEQTTSSHSEKSDVNEQMRVILSKMLAGQTQVGVHMLNQMKA